MGSGGDGGGIGGAIGVGQGEPGGPGNIGGIGSMGMGGEMGPGVEGAMGGGPDAGGPPDIPKTTPYLNPEINKNENTLPNFKIDPQQVMNDINLYGQWGATSTMPQMTPFMNPFNMYGQSQAGFNWPGYLRGFK